MILRHALKTCFRHSVCSNLVALLQYKTRLVDGDVATIELVVAGDDGGRC